MPTARERARELPCSSRRSVSQWHSCTRARGNPAGQGPPTRRDRNTSRSATAQRVPARRSPQPGPGGGAAPAGWTSAVRIRCGRQAVPGGEPAGLVASPRAMASTRLAWTWCRRLVSCAAKAFAAGRTSKAPHQGPSALGRRHRWRQPGAMTDLGGRGAHPPAVRPARQTADLPPDYPQKYQRRSRCVMDAAS